MRFAGNADALTRFFGTFNFTIGTISFLLQLLVTGPVLRRFGIAVTVLLLPLSLGFGSSLILLAPGLTSVLLTNAFDQGFPLLARQGQLQTLYLPIPPAQRVPLKNTIDIIVNRIADGCGALLLGLATKGFAFIPGLNLGLRGTATINLVFLSMWAAVAWRLRREYVRTIHDSIHRHRLDTERAASTTIERAAADALRAKLAAGDASEVRYALGLLEVQQTRSWLPALRALLSHPESDIRRRALSLLRASGDREIAERAVELLKDSDLGVHTEALLYLTREMHVDPLSQIQKLGDFDDFSIRAGMAAFLASPGPAQNVIAARALIEGLVNEQGETHARDRAEAARLIALVPDGFLDLLSRLIKDENEEVAREAIRSAKTISREELVDPLMSALDRPDLADEAAAALASCGNAIIPEIEERLRDEHTSVEIRRELPTVLVRIGTAEAEQALIGSLLQADVTLRHRVIASLNKLRVLHPEVPLDPSTINLLLAAEIAGHYRSYQVLGPLRERLKEDDPVLQAMEHAMEQELDRIFRLMALLLPHVGLHDAYVGLRSSDELRAREFARVARQRARTGASTIGRAAARLASVGGGAHRVGQQARRRAARLAAASRRDLVVQRGHVAPVERDLRGRRAPTARSGERVEEVRERSRSAAQAECAGGSPQAGRRGRHPNVATAGASEHESWRWRWVIRTPSPAAARVCARSGG